MNETEAVAEAEAEAAPKAEWRAIPASLPFVRGSAVSCALNSPTVGRVCGVRCGV